MSICENCGNEYNGNYGSGRFCSSVCARGFSTKAKRIEINEKVSLKIKGSGNPSLKIICENCKKEFEIQWSKRDQITCSRLCSIRLTHKDPLYLANLSNKAKARCSSIEERIRLREIGRKGGFGEKGITKNGIHYQSRLEKKCFELLDDQFIEFEAHKSLPNSSKMSDVFLPKFNVWIEIDGINREKKKKWLGKDYDYWLEKLKQYESQQLNLKIVYSLEDLQYLVKTLIT